jgi:hypothetical protein
MVSRNKKHYFDRSVTNTAGDAMPLWYRMNHSAWIKSNVMPCECLRGVVWVARRNIVAGEELVWDYDRDNVLFE